MNTLLKLKYFLKFSLVLLFIFSSAKMMAQDSNEESLEKPAKVKGLKRFQIGLYLGTYFANNSTAYIYNGYGYDINGFRNDFANSFMYRRIVNDYGGNNGQPDYVAQALGVNHGDWTFGESDMPVNLAYNVAFMVGLQTRYLLNRRDALLLNLNVSQLNVSGDFTITITTPINSSTTQTPNYQNFRTCVISGREQRLMLQLGYQRLLGDIGKMNFFLEGGFISTWAKYDRNIAVINTLQIDLATLYNQPGYVSYRPKVLNGIGLGAFGGFGINFNLHPNLVIQLLYSPSYETINIGDNPSPALQQAIGLRAYGHF